MSHFFMGNNTYFVGITGSRSIIDQQYVNEIIGKYLSENFGDEDEIILLVGDANGVDKCAKQWAKVNNVRVIEFIPACHYFSFPLEYKDISKMFYARNQNLVENCDALLAIWDGHSGGTKQTIEYAKHLNKDVAIFK